VQARDLLQGRDTWSLSACVRRKHLQAVLHEDPVLARDFADISERAKGHKIEVAHKTPVIGGQVHEGLRQLECNSHAGEDAHRTAQR
jgi:hypothetical protein